MKQILQNQSLHFYFLAMLIILLLLVYLDTSWGYNRYDILVEGHGVLFDLLVFGIIHTVYEVSKKDKNLIRQYKEQIEDLRVWKGSEASYRISGLVRRLCKLGVSKIDLSNCFLKEGNLSNLNLVGATFNNANLEKANFMNTELNNVDLTGANLKGANLSYTDLSGAILREVEIDETTIFDKLSVYKGLKVDEKTAKYLEKRGFKKKDFRL